MVDVVNQCARCGRTLSRPSARFCSRDCREGREHHGWGRRGHLHALLKHADGSVRTACDRRLHRGEFLKDQPQEYGLCEHIGCLVRRTK